MMHFINSFGAFIIHLVVALALLGGFVAAYLRSTPHDEQGLIAKGNAAAAFALGGAVIGYAIVLQRAIAYSDSVLEMILWGAIGLVIQVLGHWTLARFMPRLYTSIEQNEMSAGFMTAAVAIALGLVNAASMTP